MVMMGRSNSVRPCISPKIWRMLSLQEICEVREADFRRQRGTSVVFIAQTLVPVKVIINLALLLWDVFSENQQYPFWFIYFRIVALGLASLTSAVILHPKGKGYTRLIHLLYIIIIFFDYGTLLLQQYFRLIPAPQVEGYLLVMFYICPMIRAFMWFEIVFINVAMCVMGMIMLNFQQHSCGATGVNHVVLYGVHVGISLVMAYLLEKMERQAFGLQVHLEQEAKVERKNANNFMAFMALMSHEIRTPLNGILGVLDLLLKSGTLGPQHLMLVTNMKVATDSLIQIVSDILDMANMSAGKLSLTNMDLNVRKLVDKCLKVIDPKLKVKQLKCTVALSPNVPNVVLGDPIRMVQILSNLLSNAIKFTLDMGTIGIKIDVSMKPRAVDPNHVWLSFEVRDSGRGMTDPELSSLFSPYYQGDSGINRTHEGTGLGLTIVKALIDLMGGTVKVRSEIGLGTQFLFSIPFRLKERSRTEPEASLCPRGLNWTSLCFLVVDDTPLNVMVLQTHLQHRGAKVLSARDGEECIKVYTAHPDEIDVILMDIWMPVMDGLEATKGLREMGCVKPIVAMTADYTSTIATQAFEVGMNKVLLKPIVWDQLEEELCSLVVHLENV